ncbi:pyridoxal phosphate-dependent decarboxylase family protein [Longirhabdus pacifica]|uniref:pyridoxal phosphate-dependent decarboxylase family protein n=1 Tax=Longirhabdus pacifica TaxID=2305227 RepID=UPI0010089AB3|nr:pyridoxal-dependent decarboxylase [Longirhabdus pacifica]
MHPHLEHDKLQFQALLEQVKHHSVSHYDQIADHVVSPVSQHKEHETLPANGLGGEQTLQYFIQKFNQDLKATAGPRYFGFVTGGATPASIAGDWLSSIYDQNAMGGNQGDVEYVIEQEALSLFKQLLDLPDSLYASFVSGATMANFVSLAVGRQWLAKQQGINVAEEGLFHLNAFPILSATPHSSIYKAISMLGIGRKQLQVIPKQENREAIDIPLLEQQLQKLNGTPCIVIANCGTVNTGDSDDLHALLALKEAYPFWLHVDAAFAGIAACSPRYQAMLSGIEKADSITIDAHKWLNVPYDSAIQLTKHKALQYEVFYNAAPYLGHEPSMIDYTPENSRRLRALPVWFALMAYGKEGYIDIVERHCRIASLFGEKIKKSKLFTLLSPVHLNIVCFTLDQKNITKETIHQFLVKLNGSGKTFLTPTVYQGIPAIRIAVSNWITTEDDVKTTWDAIVAAASHE